MSRQVAPRFAVNHAPGPAAQQCAVSRQRTVTKPSGGAIRCVHVAPPFSVASNVLAVRDGMSLPTAIHALTDPQPIDVTSWSLGAAPTVHLAPASCVARSVVAPW